MASSWKFYAYRPVSGEFMDTDVQLQSCSLYYGLSAINAGTATLVNPDVVPLGSDGRPVWGRWDTIFMAERNGNLDWCGLVDQVAPTQAGAQLGLIGLSAWLSRVDYSGVYQVWETNTFDVLRELLSHANGKPRGLTFTYPGALMSATTVGSPNPPAKPHKPGRHKHESKSDFHASSRYTTWQADLATWNDTYGDNQKYKLVWWDAPRVGEEITSLANESGFDWREQYHWTAPLEPEFKFNFADDLTVVRNDIQLIDGVNVVGRLIVNDNDTSYANKAIVLGAGHGRKMRRETSSFDDGRLYSTRYVHKKHIKHKRRLQKVADQSVKSFRRLDPQVGTVNAYDVDGFSPMETLKPGDIIPVKSNYVYPRVNVMALVKSKTEDPLNPGMVQLELVTQNS